MTGYNADMAQPNERDEQTVTERLAQLQLENARLSEAEINYNYEKENAKEYRNLAISLAEGVISLAESLDWEIGDDLKNTLKLMANRYMIDPVTKTVNVTGTVTRTYTFSIDVECAIWDDEDMIDVDDHEDEILDSLSEWDIIAQEIEAE